MNDRRVLVADDDAASRVILKRLLERAGYPVEAVADGQAAVERSAAEPPTLALLDLGMPVLDGFEAAAAIRRQPAPRPVLIAMSASSRDEHAGRMQDFDDFLAKPFARDRLLACMARWGAGGGREALDTAVLGELEQEIGADSAGEVLLVFFAEMSRRVEEIVSASASASASGPGARATLQRAAHQLKANAGTVGAAELARCAAELEVAAGAGNDREIARLVGELRGSAPPVLAELQSRAAQLA